MKKILNKQKGPEDIIQEDIIKYLKIRDWWVKIMHGNMFQSGVPDLYIAHARYGTRWVEVKNPLAYRFTQPQLEDFRHMSAKNVGIWVLVAATHEEYNKLFLPPNWMMYLKV